MKEKLETHRKIYEFFLQYKLNGIVRFYNESKRLANNEVVYINTKIEENGQATDQRELSSRKDEYLGWFREMLIHNCFLMIHSHLEETLAIIFRAFDAGKTICNGSDIGRFKEPFIEKHQIKISESPKWNFLLNCSKTRHLILHANGNLSLARGPAEAKETCRRLGSNVVIRKSQIVLQERILQEFADAVADTTNWLLCEIEKTKA